MPKNPSYSSKTGKSAIGNAAKLLRGHKSRIDQAVSGKPNNDYAEQEPHTRRYYKHGGK